MRSGERGGGRFAFVCPYNTCRGDLGTSVHLLMYNTHIPYTHFSPWSRCSCSCSCRRCSSCCPVLGLLSLFGLLLLVDLPLSHLVLIDAHDLHPGVAAPAHSPVHGEDDEGEDELVGEEEEEEAAVRSRQGLGEGGGGVEAGAQSGGGGQDDGGGRGGFHTRADELVCVWKTFFARPPLHVLDAAHHYTTAAHYT